MKVVIEVPEPTPLMNTVLRKHWRARGRERDRWAWMIRASLKAFPKAPLKACRIHIERYSTGLPDWDGLYGGIKNCLDCLVAPTKRNPSGLGIIQDDSPKFVKALTAMPVVCRKGEEKTRIFIEEC